MPKHVDRPSKKIYLEVEVDSTIYFIVYGNDSKPRWHRHKKGTTIYTLHARKDNTHCQLGQL